MLLPVQPPEINTILLHRMHGMPEHILHELLVRTYPFYPLFISRIIAQTFSKSRITPFVMFKTSGRMEIQGDLQTVFFHTGHEFLRIRENASVPRPPGPCSSARIGVMPIHIYDKYIKRDVIRLHLRHQIPEFLVRICPITRPPVAESKPRRKRHLSCKDSKVLQCRLVVIAIRHEVPILTLLGLTFLDPGPFGIIEKVIV